MVGMSNAALYGPSGDNNDWRPAIQLLVFDYTACSSVSWGCAGEVAMIFPVAKVFKVGKIVENIADASDAAADAAADATKVAAKSADEVGEVTKKAPVHHICTNKNCVSTARGGPWTPRFDEIFKKAGLDLDDAVNKVAIPGHKGPHPEAYHSYVHKELLSATRGLKANSDAYRNAVTGTLDRIKTEATTVGSQVNRWLTKQ
ncbi:hypothetical protein GCU85_07115 [Cardiobacteriales bacterium ML27]|uniref:Uncharacterized protein n=2 Tax=Ostreibacterium oceani TaxID=2654998 RepID=A0A6N7EY74_9GAMM|nr:hypothetical protein [Ostreibacterium oceani]